MRIERHARCVEAFVTIPTVLSGGSEPISQVSRACGRQAHIALGHLVVPLNVPVKLEFWAEVVG
ncbi:MAG: hypothetical protein ABL900_02610 [Burkholderiaceae bacterium]